MNSWRGPCGVRFLFHSFIPPPMGYPFQAFAPHSTGLPSWLCSLPYGSGGALHRSGELPPALALFPWTLLFGGMKSHGRLVNHQCFTSHVVSKGSMPFPNPCRTGRTRPEKTPRYEIQCWAVNHLFFLGHGRRRARGERSLRDPCVAAR